MSRRSTGRRWPLPRDARALHGRAATCRRSPSGSCAAGRDPDEPAAVVERGTLPGQRTVTAPLARSPSAVERARVSRPPAITRDRARRAALRDTLAWLERRPLHGAGGGGDPRPGPGQRPGGATGELGAEVIEAPGDPDRAALSCDLATPRAARLRADLLHEPQRRAAAASRRCAARPGRPRAGRRDGGGHRPGHAARAAPPRHPGRRGARSAPSPRHCWRRSQTVPVEGRRVLVARAAEARDVLPDALARARRPGATCCPLRHGGRAAGRAALGQLERATYVTFTSSSTVRFFLQARRGRARGRTGGLDRPGDQRHRPRARPRGARGGRAPRHRRPGGGARGGRRGR